MMRRGGFRMGVDRSLSGDLRRDMSVSSRQWHRMTTETYRPDNALRHISFLSPDYFRNAFRKTFLKLSRLSSTYHVATRLMLARFLSLTLELVSGSRRGERSNHPPLKSNHNFLLSTVSRFAWCLSPKRSTGTFGVREYVNVRACMCMYACVCIYVRVCVCIFVYSYRIYARSRGNERKKTRLGSVSLSIFARACSLSGAPAVPPR